MLLLIVAPIVFFVVGRCFVMQYLVFFLVLRAGCFTLNVFRLSYGCTFSVTLPHGAVGWSAVCDCGISWSYLLFILSFLFCVIYYSLTLLFLLLLNYCPCFWKKSQWT